MHYLTNVGIFSIFQLGASEMGRVKRRIQQKMLVGPCFRGTTTSAMMDGGYALLQFHRG